MRPLIALGVAAIASLIATSTTTDAHACGGFFPGQDAGSSTAVIGDHRMVLSISKDQTTLYDQMRFQGSPSSLAWVVPVHGTIDIGLSADVLFATLEKRTTVFVAGTASCPQLYCCWGIDGGASGGDAGVIVNKQEVIGPYETAQLSSSDPQALAAWLTQHGYVIPSSIAPVLATYVSEGFDFVAMKLVPGATVQSMRPVRLTAKGAGASIPLRMVAAGIAKDVGLSLWVIGEGRYEPKNFPSFVIPDKDLTWYGYSSNYFTLLDNANAKAGWRGWELQSSMVDLAKSIRDTVRGGGETGPIKPAALDYEAQTSPTPLTADQVREADLETLFHGMNEADIRVSFYRSRIAAAGLDQDLVLGAATDQSTVPNRRVPTTNDLSSCATTCPGWSMCDGGRDSGNPDSSGSGGSSSSETGGCSTSSESSSSAPLSAFASLGFVGLAALVRRVIRKRRS